MISHKQVERQLIPILRPLLTLTTEEINTYQLRRANQKQSLPDSGGYSVIKCENTNEIGQGELGDYVEDVGFRFKTDLRAEITIQTFDDEAILRANKLRMQLRNPLILATLAENGFSYVDCNPVVDLTAIRDESYEERSSVTMMFNIMDGDFSADSEVPPEDLGKAGTAQFFNVDAINSVTVEQYRLGAEDPYTTTPINQE